ncbi:MAG: hypothetical protein ACK4FS_10670 [Flavobacterium sp.]
MKYKFKFLAVFLLVALTFSCSSDDDNGSGSFIKARFNNTNLVFKITSVEELGPYTVDGYTYFDIKVNAEAKNDPNKTLIISSEKGVVGANLIWRFDYYDESLFYSKVDGLFSTNITENSNNKYVGTFSGTIRTSDGSNVITLSNGVFNVSY